MAAELYSLSGPVREDKEGEDKEGGGRLPSSIVDDESDYQSVLCFVRERCWVKKGRLAEAHLTVWR